MHVTADPVEGELAAGPRSLRLVRLRLMLALVAMAVIPVAVGAPLVATALDGQRTAERLRTEQAASAVATSLDSALGRLGADLVRAGGAAALSRMADGHDRDPAAARAVIVGLSKSAGVRWVTLLDLRGRELLRASSGKAVRTAATTIVDPLVGAGLDAEVGDVAWGDTGPAPDGSTVLGLVTPVAGLSRDGPPSGLIRVELDLADLVAASADGIGGQGQSILTNGRGVTLASAALGADRARDTTPAESNRALATNQTVAASAAVGSRPGWTIRFVAPSRFAATPYPLIILLSIFVGLLAVLIVWMARQVLRPAEELEASRARLHDLYDLARVDSLRDALTGLGNHRAFQEEFDRQVETARTRSTTLGLVLVDLDDFKAVNDAGGHGAGDAALGAFGRVVAANLRPADRAFRTGGDEFALLLPGTTAEGADAAARRLLAAATDRRGGGGRPDPIPFSAGVSACPALATDRRQLLAQADAALAWAKHHGRAAVETFDPARHHEANPASAVSELSSAILDIVERRLLRPVYQPIVDLRSGRFVGYEGLIRPLAASGFTDPGGMFAAAETAGRTVELDATCLEVVTGGARGLVAGSALAVNLSARTLESESFSLTRLVDLARSAGLEPAKVILELTEREGVEEMERLRRNVAACREVGFRIAADDVGAGNAGLRLLSQIQFDIVKIDLSLVQGGAIHEGSLSVIGALQDLARRWGATVVAEGIETPEQLRVVRELEIAAGQGYLLGRPGSAEDLITLQMNAVDIDGLLGHEDWLHQMVRRGSGMTVPVSMR